MMTYVDDFANKITGVQPMPVDGWQRVIDVVDAIEIMQRSVYSPDEE